MCSNDELRSLIQEAEDRFDKGMRIMGAEIGRVSSFSHDAKAASEATHASVKALNDVLYMLHGDDEKKRELMWAEIKDLQKFKSQWLGIFTGVSFVFAALWSLAVIAWNYLTK